jgi:tetratricopeptide (TPR) repeat protein
MNIEDARKILDLPETYDLSLLKQQYRQKAKHCHPDLNPDNPVAHQAFIDITEALNLLEKHLEELQSKTEVNLEQNAKFNVTIKRTPAQPKPELNLEEELLKESELRRINELLKQEQIARCIIIIEALVEKLPQDYTLKTRKAWLYYDYAKHLIKQKRIELARKYLKAATKLAPRDASLWTRINQIYNRIEHQY